MSNTYKSMKNKTQFNKNEKNISNTYNVTYGPTKGFSDAACLQTTS